MNDISGSITSGGTAQALAAADPNRCGFMIENLHATSALWFNVNLTAVENQPSIKVPAGALYETPPNLPASVVAGTLSIIGPTTSQTFTAKTW